MTSVISVGTPCTAVSPWNRRVGIPPIVIRSEPACMVNKRRTARSADGVIASMFTAVTGLVSPVREARMSIHAAGPEPNAAAHSGALPDVAVGLPFRHLAG
jgi:hypothetical protein